MDRSPIHALVPLALRGGALANRCQDHDVIAAHLGAEPDPGGVCRLGGDRR